MGDNDSLNPKFPTFLAGHIPGKPNAAVVDLLAKEPKPEFRDTKLELAIHSHKMQVEISEKLDTLIENSHSSSKLSKKSLHVAILTLIVALLTLLASVCIPFKGTIVNWIKRIGMTTQYSS